VSGKIYTRQYCCTVCTNFCCHWSHWRHWPCSRRDWKL